MYTLPFIPFVRGVDSVIPIPSRGIKMAGRYNTLMDDFDYYNAASLSGWDYVLGFLALIGLATLINWAVKYWKMSRKDTRSQIDRKLDPHVPDLF